MGRPVRWFLPPRREQGGGGFSQRSNSLRLRVSVLKNPRRDTPAILAELAQFFSAPRIQRAGGAFLVGGFLRDALLAGPAVVAGNGPAPPPDLDIAVPVAWGEVQDLGRELAQRLGSVHVPLGPAHGVARVVVDPVEPAERAAAPSPSPRLRTIDLSGFSGSIEADLARRDFTVNALALPLSQWRIIQEPPGGVGGWAGAVIDPFGGRGDLTQKRLRAVSPGVFRADPGRLLRGVRLAGQLKFRLEPETARHIRANAPRLEQVAPERVRDEFLALLAGDGARGQLEVLDRLDLLCRIIPELSPTKGFAQPRVHYWDVWNHLLHTVEYAEMVTRGHQNSAIYSLAPWTAETAEYFGQEAGDGHTRRTILKLAGLLHDIAKPQTRQPDATGRIRFPGHSELGAAMAEARLTHLRLSARSVALVARMVERHLRPAQLRQGRAEPSRRAIYRYFRDVKEVAVDTIYLAMADYRAAKGPEIDPDHWANHARMLAYVLQTGAQQLLVSAPMSGWTAGPVPAPGPARLLTGHDLMRHFNLPPGPQIGRLLAQLDEAQAVGEVATRAEALELAAAALAPTAPPALLPAGEEG